jgi:intracellular sulfur oxidation DsrE/DsrF family protein
MEDTIKINSRRKFLGKMAAGTAVGLGTLASPLASFSNNRVNTSKDAEVWFKKAKGSHRIVYDASEPHNALPIIWSWVFYQTNNESGTPDNDMTAMVVLRHNAIPFAFEDRIWKKYKLGEVFNITDNTTKKHSERNPYYTPGEGDFPFPGIDGIKKLQDRGAMFCVCNMALKVYSGVVAQKFNLNAADVLSDWMSGIQPNVQVVPSGVWAVGRAQENGFGYCYAGG